MAIEESRVLVVDDEADLADMYAGYLEDEYEVDTAYNGGEALVYLEEDVDVVVLDRKMPGIQGEEVLEQIREWLDWCRVVMVTGVEPDFDITTLAFDEYLEKPVTETELRDTVHQVLLLDEYEQLLNEYISVSRRYATLKSHKEPPELQTSEEFATLSERREELRGRIGEIVTDFTDDEFADAFSAIHGLD